MSYLIGLVIALCGIIFFQNRKNLSLLGILNLLKFKEKDLKDFTKSSLLKSKIKEQEEYRTKLKTKEKVDESDEDLSDYFNRHTD